MLRTAFGLAVVLSAGVASGCETSSSEPEHKPEPGPDPMPEPKGSCASTVTAEGVTRVACLDGLVVELAEGGAHEGCAITSKGDGNWVLSCGDGFEATIAEAEPTRLFFGDERTRLWTATVKPGGQVTKQQVADVAQGRAIEQFRVSPDGSHVLLAERPSPYSCEEWDPAWELRLVGLHGDEASYEVALPLMGRDALFGSDSTALVYVQRSEESVYSGALALVDLPAAADTAEPHQLSGCVSTVRDGYNFAEGDDPQHRRPIWSASDGRWALFTSCATGRDGTGGSVLSAIEVKRGKRVSDVRELARSVRGVWTREGVDTFFFTSDQDQRGRPDLYVASLTDGAFDARRIVQGQAGDKLEVMEISAGGSALVRAQGRRAYYFDASRPGRIGQDLGAIVEQDLEAVWVPGDARFCFIERGYDDSALQIGPSALRCAPLGVDEAPLAEAVFETAGGLSATTHAIWPDTRLPQLASELLLTQIVEGEAVGKLWSFDLATNTATDLQAFPNGSGIVYGPVGDAHVLFLSEGKLRLLAVGEGFSLVEGFASPVLEAPAKVSYLKTGENLWFATTKDGLSRIPLAEPTGHERVGDLPGRELLLSPNERHILAGGKDRMALIDTADDPATISALPVDGFPVDAAYSATGHELLVFTTKESASSRYGRDAGRLTWTHVGAGKPGTTALVHDKIGGFALTSSAQGGDWLVLGNPADPETCN